MPVLSIPNVFVQGTTINAAPFNANFNAVATSVNNVDNSQIGAAGIFASQIIPTSSAFATFGGTVGYSFYNATAGVTPLTVSGVAGQSVDIFDVTLTSGGTKAAWLTSVGAFNVGAGGQAAMAGDGGFSRGASTGAIALGGGTSAATIDYGITTPLLLSINKSVVITGAFVAGGIVNVNALSGDIVGARSASTGAILFGSTASASGVLFFDGVRYNFFAVGGGSSTANIVASTGVYTATSDERLKENFAALPYGLEAVRSMNALAFDYIADKSRGLGFKAQEMQKIVPEVVTVVDDSAGYLGINYSGLVPVLVKAIQELAAEVKSIREWSAA